MGGQTSKYEKLDETGAGQHQPSLARHPASDFTAVRMEGPRRRTGTAVNDVNIQMEDWAAEDAQEASAILSAGSTAVWYSPRPSAEIVSRQLREQRDKHTVYKIRVEHGTKKWSVYRRYTEFEDLNKQVKSSKLKLPRKNVFESRFNEGVLNRRQKGLQQFLNTLLQMWGTDDVQTFLMVENPPSPFEDPEDAEAHCKEIKKERDMLLAEKDKQLKKIGEELDKVKAENERLSQLNIQRQEKVRILGDKLKKFEDQLASCQDRERKIRQERDKLIEQREREREAELQAAQLNEEKQELAMKELLMKYDDTQLEIKRQIEACMAPLLATADHHDNGHPASDDVINGFDEWRASVGQLEETLAQGEELMKSCHVSVVEQLNAGVQNLKADLATNDLRLKASESEVTRCKAELQQMDSRMKRAMKEAKAEKETRESVEKLLFGSLFRQRDDSTNNGTHIQDLFNQVRQQQIPAKEWERWLNQHVKGPV